MARIDEFLAQSATPSESWSADGRRQTRTYSLGDVLITVHLNTRSRVASIIYPMQPFECETEDLPTVDAESVTLPTVLKDSLVQPKYPELARRAWREGVVVLQAIVRSDGSVSDVCVLLVTHHGLGFEEAAIDAVSQWRYTSPMSNGEPVDVYFTVTVNFDLVDR